ncbi:MAG: hypothetical protein ACPIOQ_83775, partial [Promethearchaeia archaeon]
MHQAAPSFSPADGGNKGIALPPGAADTAALRYSHHRLPAPPTPPQPALGRALPFKGCVLGPE